MLDHYYDEDYIPRIRSYWDWREYYSDEIDSSLESSDIDLEDEKEVQDFIDELYEKYSDCI